MPFVQSRYKEVFRTREPITSDVDLRVLTDEIRSIRSEVISAVVDKICDHAVDYALSVMQPTSMDYMKRILCCSNETQLEKAMRMAHKSLYILPIMMLLRQPCDSVNVANQTYRQIMKTFKMTEGKKPPANTYRSIWYEICTRKGGILSIPEFSCNTDDLLTYLVRQFLCFLFIGRKSCQSFS